MAGDVPPAWAAQDSCTRRCPCPAAAASTATTRPPGSYEPARGFSLTTNPPDVDTARAVFDALAGGGRVTQPLEATFWAVAFGTLVDRFGVPWAINCEPPQT